MASISQPQGTQSIRFLYNELRRIAHKGKGSGDSKSGARVVDPTEVDDAYFKTVICRTFDALDNSITTLFNAKQVVESLSNVSRVTFGFSSLTGGLESPHVKVPSRIGVSGYIPLTVDINAVGVPTGAGTQFDIQFSKDDIVWNSLLAFPITLPTGNKYITTFTNFSGTNILDAGWVRCVPTVDFTPTEVQVEMDVVAFQ